MSEIEYMLNNKKVSYPDFVDFVKANPLKEFLHHFQYPFLVGNDLYAGEMQDNNSGQDGTVQKAESLKSPGEGCCVGKPSSCRQLSAARK